MTKQYYSIITDYGTKAIANAIAQKQPLQIMQMAVGDGNGQTPTPNSNYTALIRETHRANISAISVDPRNNKQIIFELTIPENIGGFWIREMGVFDHNNRLIAYANCPDSFKPQLDSGSGKVQVIRMILLVSSSDAITLKVDDSVIFVTRGQLTPKTITAISKNGVDETGHSHEIDKATTEQAGITQLVDDLTTNDRTKSLTARAGFLLKGMIDSITRSLSNCIPNSKKSDAIDSDSSDNVATSFAAKKAYDKAVEAEKKALPVGSIVSFPKAITNPEGFLRCDGATFSQSLYPDLFHALNDSNQLPNLHRSDVGMTAYFATDNIPDGWLAFDDIASRVNERDYPELYLYLVDKYGSIANVPKAEDRFIRNVNEGLSVGQKQNATAGAVDTYNGTTLAGLFVVEDSNPDGRHIQKTRDTIGGDNFYTDEYILNKGGSSRGGLYALWASPSGGIINPDGTADGATKDVVLYGMRPRSIVLKLCIKAKNALDDVQFWIKAFGVVSNIGELDAGQFAQSLQDKADKATTLAGYGITDGLRLSDFPSALTENGYQRLPTGLLFQWGTVLDVRDNTTVDITFPVSFTQSARFVIGGFTQDAGTSGTDAVSCFNVTTRGMTIRVAGNNTKQNINWQAIGV